MSKNKAKFKLSSLTSKQGLITGTILGIITVSISIYFLVPIFEKSESNAIEIIEVNKTLEKTEDEFSDTKNELKETQQDLEISNKKVQSLSNVKADLQAAVNQISQLEEASEKDNASIGELQEQVETQEENIQILTKQTQNLNSVINDKKLEIKKRSQWIKDLKKHDDTVIKNATNLVENFMKISDSEDKDMNSFTREKLLVDTLALVNSLESRLNKRRIFLEDLEEKLKGQ